MEAVKPKGKKKAAGELLVGVVCRSWEGVSGVHALPLGSRVKKEAPKKERVVETPSEVVTEAEPPSQDVSRGRGLCCTGISLH
jgi:hypothetical protein